jgi:hypothetical protein
MNAAAPTCTSCQTWPAEPGIPDCLECWAAQPANTEAAMVKVRAGVPFRQAKIEALRDFLAKKARP